MTLSYPEAMTIIGGLSTTSKMPWFSWSISAEDCVTGEKLRQVEGSVCSDCYACKGCYVFQSVKNAHNRRKEALANPRFVEAFSLVLNTAFHRGRKTYISRGVTYKENRFRWHDSGDLQSLDHLEKINQIALNTPNIIHWLPTKEIGILKEFLKKHIEGFSPNLTVRLSHPMIGGTWEKSPMDLPFSTVSTGLGVKCPAPQQGGKCSDCKNCWIKHVKSVDYKKH